MQGYRISNLLTAVPKAVSNFKRCWPYSEKSPTYGIEKLFEKGNEAFILYDCKTKNDGSSRNTEFFTIEGNKIKEVEVYFGSAPKEPA
jgi:hypothetical protein